MQLTPKTPGLNNYFSREEQEQEKKKGIATKIIEVQESKYKSLQNTLLKWNQKFADLENAEAEVKKFSAQKHKVKLWKPQLTEANSGLLSALKIMREIAEELRTSYVPEGNVFDLYMEMSKLGAMIEKHKSSEVMQVNSKPDQN